MYTCRSKCRVCAISILLILNRGSAGNAWDTGKEKLRAELLELGRTEEITKRAVSDPRLVEQLLSFLGDRNLEAAKSAATILSRVGKSAEPGLIVGLDSPVEQIRFLACDAIIHIAPRPVDYLPLLRKRLTDASPRVRQEAVKGLRELRDNKCLSDIALIAERDKNVRVRAEAMNALGDFGEKGSEFILIPARVLEQRLTMEDPDSVALYRAAAASLAEMGPKAVTRALDRIRNNSVDAGIRGNYLFVLQAMSIHSPDQLVAHVTTIAMSLEDAEEQNRLIAIVILGNLGDRADPVFSSLVGLYKRGTDRDKRNVAFACSAIRSADPETIRFLAKQLRDKEEASRIECLSRLAGIREKAADAIPEIEASLQDSSVTVRLAAIKALLSIGKHARKAVPSLRQLSASDPSTRVREAAASAIKRIEQ